MNDAVIKIDGLNFAYGDKPVLRAINITVAAGEVFGLVGADGAGKTTLLRMAAGQLMPSSGTIEVLGKPPADPDLRNNMAYMPQGFGLYQDLSVLENLEFFADLHGLPKALADSHIRDLLRRTGLTGFEQRRAGQLSGGMMQKLALACALVTEPKVMFLDEPTTGVDPLSRRAFWQLLDGVRAQGVAILYATANMDEAERCDRVGMLQDGSLLRQGTPLQLAASEELRLAGVFGSGIRRYRHALRELPGVRLVFSTGSRLNVWLNAQHPWARFEQDLAGLAPSLSARRLEPSLHDAALRDLALAQQEHAAHAAN
jgi:ABC-2 type transport system ATP-binding protein